MGEENKSGMLSLFFTKVKPYLAMVSLQFGYAGMYIITMVSLKHGMSNWIFVTYRHVVATIVIAPFALVLERKIRPKLTLSVFLKIVALAFLEPVLDQNLYVLGMKYTSASFASATVNVLPALTFIMAVIFRLEKVDYKKIQSLAKVIGTTITLSGAMLMTLYKGPIVDILWYSKASSHNNTSNTSADQHWVIGTIMLICCTGGWSSFFILQSITLKEYPAELSLTGLICFMGMVECAVAALVMERDMSTWALGFDSRLLAAVYSGVVCSGIAYYVQGVVNRVRGPVFVTSFSPLCMIITAILGALILAEKIHLGSLIGAIIIVCGLYSVVWGKSRDPLNSEEEITRCEKDTAYELPIVDSNNKKQKSNSTNVDDDDDISDHVPAANKLKIPAKNGLSISQEP